MFKIQITAEYLAKDRCNNDDQGSPKALLSDES